MAVVFIDPTMPREGDKPMTYLEFGKLLHQEAQALKGGMSTQDAFLMAQTAYYKWCPEHRFKGPKSSDTRERKNYKN